MVPLVPLAPRAAETVAAGAAEVAKGGRRDARGARGRVSKTRGRRSGRVRMARRFVLTVSMRPRAMLPLAWSVRMTPAEMVVGPRKKMARPYASSRVAKGTWMIPKLTMGVMKRMERQP